LGEQHIIAELAHPHPLGCGRECVQHAVLTREEVSPVAVALEAEAERRLGAEECLPGFVRQPNVRAGHASTVGKWASTSGSLSWYGEVPERLSPRLGLG